MRFRGTSDDKNSKPCPYSGLLPISKSLFPIAPKKLKVSLGEGTILGT